jgi:PKD repeat protein
MRARLILLSSMATLVLSLSVRAQYTQVVYSPGRCNGSATMIMGDEIKFYPLVPPGPDPFVCWILVQSGQGDVILTDDAGGTSTGLYMNTGDLIMLKTLPPYTLYFQGGTMTVAWGGAVLGASSNPVCATGVFGPVVLRVDKRYDAKVESSTAGVGLQVASYGIVTQRTSGSLVYDYVSARTLQGTFGVPQCTGGGCCSPTEGVFPVNNAGTAAYTVYTVTSSPAKDFDYQLGLPAALAAAASAAPTSGAPPLTVAFTGSATGGTQPYTWDWDFGDGTAHKTVKSPNHTYSAAGTYHPILKVKDAAGAVSKDTHLTITVAASFSVAANATPAQGSAPLTVAFTATPSGGAVPLTYGWTFGDGATSTEQNPSHTYEAIGDYHPVVTVHDAASNTATDDHLVIHALGPGALTATASADRTFGTLPLTVNFTGAGTGGTQPYSYRWTFGDGSDAVTEQNPSHTFATVGSFPVTLTVTDSGAQAATDDHLRIYVTSSFLVTASATPTTGPAPLTVQFSAALQGGTAPYQYSWTFGDGGTSTEAAPSHVYAADGSYNAVLAVVDNGGQGAVDNHLLIAVGTDAAPVITGVSKVAGAPSFRLKVKGTGFQPGCIIFANETPVPVTVYKSSTQLVAKQGSALKALFPKGVPVCVQVRNPDGFVSGCSTYAR